MAIIRNYNDGYGNDDGYSESYSFGDDMTHPTASCSRFARRHDFSTFNMMDYSTCENCKHLTSDSGCAAKSNGQGTWF